MTGTERRRDAARTVSANVRRLRKARGWLQVEAAQRFGEELGEYWSRTVWSLAESASGGRQRAWTADELAAMARVFGVAVGDLFSECCSQCQGEPPVGFTCNTCGGVS